ncbi:MAG: UDP-N-acetylmuramoyl-tripeptide--D-alanyl-D-alanine ligase [Acidimicrobiales bacterium]
MLLRLSEIAAASGGTLVGEDGVVDGVTIDSRALEPGSLFVPIVAARDGHDFIAAARERGAVAHLTARPGGPEPHVVVADTTDALQQIALAARRDRDPAVVGITGSVGKTTTKDLLHAALAPCRRVHASTRSFNNELGVPLTLLNAPDDAEVVVTEMGARGIGHIALLCSIAEPSVGVVLAVGAAHTELLGDLEGVARAKGEMVEGLAPSGHAVLNADDPRVAAMAARTAATVVTYGSTGDVRARDLSVDDGLCPRFVVDSPWGSAPVRLASAGVHSVGNALAAISAAMIVGGDLDAVAGGLGEAEVSPWRMEVGRSAAGGTVVNDAYNANPMSVHAAIDALLALPATRRVAVLGIMAELGDCHLSEHRRVGERLRAENIELIAVGTADYGGSVADDVEAAMELLDPSTLGEGTAVLVKGSRVAGLEVLAARLIGDAGHERPTPRPDRPELG